MASIASTGTSTTARSAAAALAILLAFAGAAPAGDVDRLDAEHGFRDARFGAPLDSFTGLELLSSNGARGTTLYVRPEEDLSFGQANLDGVTYGFYADRLYFVTLFASGEGNARAALAEIRERYGPGAVVPGDAEEFVWRGRRVSLHFRQDPMTDMSMVVITSLEMNAHVEAARVAGPAAALP